MKLAVYSKNLFNLSCLVLFTNFVKFLTSVSFNLPDLKNSSQFIARGILNYFSFVGPSFSYLPLIWVSINHLRSNLVICLDFH